MDIANARPITVSIGSKIYPAQIAGARLDYPFIWAKHENGYTIDAEISWLSVERMAAGELTNIIIS